jgi:uncharacterized phage protein (TIGR01671 family)
LEYNRKDDVARIHTYKEDGSYGKQYLVDPYTVGQFTGLTDKNGVKIFEGDVVKRISVNSDSSLYYDCGVVIFDNGNASFKLSMYKCVFNGRDIGLFDDDDDATCNFVTNVVYGGQTPQEDEYYYEVIGNIHNNPELLATK